MESQPPPVFPNNNPNSSKGDYKKDLILIGLVSLGFFVPVLLLILLAAADPNADFGVFWLILPFVFLFPFYLIFVVGKLFATLSSHLKARVNILSALFSGALTALLATINVHHQYSNGHLIPFLTVATVVTGVFALTSTYYIFQSRAHILLACVLLIFASSFIWLGAYGMAMNRSWTHTRLGEPANIDCGNEKYNRSTGTCEIPNCPTYYNSETGECY